MGIISTERVQHLRRLGVWVRGGGGPNAVRSAAKAPFIARADSLVGRLRTVTVRQAMAELGVERLCIEAEAGPAHGWQIGVVEQALLVAVAVQRKVKLAFELGTFDGGTTLALAQALPTGAEVHTIDLPDEAFAASQSPAAFGAADIGRCFAGLPPEGRARIVQHRGDTLTYDFAPWADSADLVLVDGAHDYPHGLADSHTATLLVRHGGVIFWDDMEAYWHGLVDGIVDAMGVDSITKIARTSLAYSVMRGTPGC